MSKIYSIVYTSQKDPSKLSMYLGEHKNFIESNAKGIERVVKNHGDLSWIPALQTSIEIPVNIYDKNSVMNIIIKKKDRKLFNSMKPYMNKNEILFISNKMKTK